MFTFYYLNNWAFFHEPGEETCLLFIHLILPLFTEIASFNKTTCHTCHIWLWLWLNICSHFAEKISGYISYIDIQPKYIGIWLLVHIAQPYVQVVNPEITTGLLGCGIFKWLLGCDKLYCKYFWFNHLMSICSVSSFQHCQSYVLFMFYVLSGRFSQAYLMASKLLRALMTRMSSQLDRDVSLSVSWCRTSLRSLERGTKTDFFLKFNLIF